MAGIYIHIPFCKNKCNYCNFYVVISLKHKDEFINSILKEIELQKEYLQNEEIRTIYFGGGTPSLLGVEEIKKIFEKIYNTYNISNSAEITIEANPDDIDTDKLIGLRTTPVNRISLGIQSLYDDDLKYLDRKHNGKLAEQAVLKLKNSGYTNISVDFIYGIPTLTNAKYQSNLERAISWGIPHISAYSLTVEPRTTLENHINRGKLAPTDEEQSAEHFRLMTQLLRDNGYLHYEISNFSKEGYYSKHNTSYWKGEKYLGIGPSAHSFNGETRQWNIRNMKEYTENISLGIIPAEKEILNDTQRYNEYVLLSLRTMWGCDSNYVLKHFDQAKYTYLLKGIKKFQSQNLLETKSGIIYLTEKGKLLADYITSELFIV